MSLQRAEHAEFFKKLKEYRSIIWDSFLGPRCCGRLRIPTEIQIAREEWEALGGEAEAYFKGRNCYLGDFKFGTFDTSQGVSLCYKQQGREH